MLPLAVRLICARNHHFLQSQFNGSCDRANISGTCYTSRRERGGWRRIYRWTLSCAAGRVNASCNNSIPHRSRRRLFSEGDGGLSSGRSGIFTCHLSRPGLGNGRRFIRERSSHLKAHGEFPTDNPQNDLFIPALGPIRPIGIFLPPDLGGIRPLTLQVPEPGFMALLALGGTVFAVARRRIVAR
jgi:hypothetical protein